MAFCAGLNDQATTWIQFTKIGEAGDGLQCPYVYMTGAEFVQLKNTELLLSELGFNPELFSQVFGYGLMVFVVGLSVGLIISIIRKAK